MTETLPAGVERAVRGFCEDYDRRAREISKGTAPAELIGYYMVLNAKIDRAIASCCEEPFCAAMRADIGNCTGHRTSQMIYLSAGTYKDRKRKTKLAIAKAFHLI